MIDQKHLPREADTLYHVQTNVSIKIGVVWGISVDTIHKGELLIFFSIVYIQKGYNYSKVKVDVRGP